MYLSKVEERLRALAERGWLPEVQPHLIGRRVAEQHRLPGPWTDHDAQAVVGWMIYMRPGTVLARRTAVPRRGGVYATLGPCLDWAEQHADREQARLDRLSQPSLQNAEGG